MFSISNRREFEAQHYLVGGSWGAENAPHTHDYVVEAIVQGEKLNRHGFLFDSDELGRQLDALLGQFKGATLNTLPDFEGLNPTPERFARILCAGLANRIRTEALSSVTIQLWQNRNLWVSYRLDF